jgi:hypothetical protein
LSVDPRGSQDIFSWTGNCSVEHFLTLGENLPGEAIATIRGNLIQGGADKIALHVRNLGPEAAEECDFVRFNWPTSSFEFQRFPPGRHRMPLTLITLVGEKINLRNIYHWIYETATEPVISEVEAVLSEANVAGQFAHEV